MPSAGSAPRDRRGRITRSRDFDAVYRRGRSAANRHLVVHLFPREAHGGGPPRLGLSVSRRVGGAVVRNRVKRVIREQWAARADRVPAGSDVVVVARPGVAAYLEERGSAALGERLAELIDRVAAGAGSGS